METNKTTINQIRKNTSPVIFLTKIEQVEEVRNE